MNKWLERRRVAKEKANESYRIWYNEEIRRYGHIRSYDEIQGWCIDTNCFKTAPHNPH